MCVSIFLKRYKTTVHRRYKDFEALFDLLLSRFPYRLVPKLPPKKAVGGMFKAIHLHCVSVDTSLIFKIWFTQNFKDLKIIEFQNK